HTRSQDNRGKRGWIAHLADPGSIHERLRAGGAVVSFSHPPRKRRDVERGRHCKVVRERRMEGYERRASSSPDRVIPAPAVPCRPPVVSATRFDPTATYAAPMFIAPDSSSTPATPAARSARPGGACAIIQHPAAILSAPAMQNATEAAAQTREEDDSSLMGAMSAVPPVPEARALGGPNRGPSSRSGADSDRLSARARSMPV
ncbi:hypothetical protein BD626DRAFT_520820, partial [Schizophyllum amplum]